MMKDPSIHIKESDLREVLKDFPFLIKETQIEELIREISKKSKPFTCINRSLVATNAKSRKVVHSLLQSDKSDANLIAQIIQMVRIRMGHTGVRKIKENGREWPQIKELANTCNSFCDEVNIEKKSGYIKYIELGFKHIKSFYGYLNKLIGLYDTIISDYQSIQSLKEVDTNAAMEVHDIYIATIAAKTGIQESYANDPIKMSCFAKAALDADAINCDYNTWVEAQFDALAFCNGIPLPEQIFGLKAKERLTKYLYKYNISLDNNNLPKSSDWDSILNS